MTPARSLRQSPALFVILTMCLFIAISNAQQGRRGIGPDTPARRGADTGLRRPALSRRPDQGLLPTVGLGLPAERRHPGRRALGRPAHRSRRRARSRTHQRNAGGAQRLRRPVGPVGRGGASAVRREPAGLLHVPEARPERGRARGRGGVSGGGGNAGAGARPLRRREHLDRRRGHLRLGRGGQRLQRGEDWSSRPTARSSCRSACRCGTRRTAAAIASARPSSPRIRAAMPARSCASMTTGPRRPTIPSQATPPIGRRSTPWGSAIRWA